MTQKERQQFGMGGHYSLHIPQAKAQVKNIICTLFFECATGRLRDDEVYFEPNRPPVWSDDYDPICEWLENNDGQGLLLFGGGGVGKTLFARTIIPTLVGNWYGKNMTYCTAHELNARKDEVLGRQLVVLDDIGTEDAVGNEYGMRRMLFPQIVDDMEQKGGMLIATTNLSTEQLQSKYGFRTFERLNRLTRMVAIGGDSLRTCHKWDEMTQDELDGWDRKSLEYAQRRKRVMEREEETAHTYLQQLEAWYGQCADACGMEVGHWLTWKTRDEKYMRSLWEQDHKEGRSWNFEMWLRAKNLHHDDEADMENI